MQPRRRESTWSGKPTAGLLRAGLEASALPEAYRDLVEVVADVGRPLRAAVRCCGSTA